MVRKITDSTAISISLVIPLIGGVFWLSQVHSKARSADEHAQNALAHVQSLEAGLMKYKESEEKKDDETRKILVEILQRLSRIEGNTRR